MPSMASSWSSLSALLSYRGDDADGGGDRLWLEAGLERCLVAVAFSCFASAFLTASASCESAVSLSLSRSGVSTLLLFPLGAGSMVGAWLSRLLRQYMTVLVRVWRTQTLPSLLLLSSGTGSLLVLGRLVGGAVASSFGCGLDGPGGLVLGTRAEDDCGAKEPRGEKDALHGVWLRALVE